MKNTPHPMTDALPRIMRSQTEKSGSIPKGSRAADLQSRVDKANNSDGSRGRGPAGQNSQPSPRSRK